ncbi:MAG: hypothetical protein AVDCRST_MAG02-3040 [uncultured Rubrobacteraceae bacterium]|uniref:Uncharacterized protein n=1 Tax=uncultured Rubrobacteraceae bacterium TaxID=349277 RepID=A0A6J4R7V9_9ACTN|nr:MAG: hypothetical protein AVDCRST_MAG02-3040 [uncultured Rubrobacteraceae bacterium]
MPNNRSLRWLIARRARRMDVLTIDDGGVRIRPRNRDGV